MQAQEVKSKFQQSGKVKIIKGSILNPENAGLRFVLSTANMAGKPENQLFPIFDKKWKKVKEDCRGWYATKTGAYKLGAINTTAVQSDVWVIHMLCQDENLKFNSEAAGECLKKVCAMAKYDKASLHISTLLTDPFPELKDLVYTNCVLNGISVIYYNES